MSNIDIQPHELLLADLHADLKASRDEATYIPLATLAGLIRDCFGDEDAQVLAAYLIEKEL